MSEPTSEAPKESPRAREALAEAVDAALIERVRSRYAVELVREPTLPTTLEPVRTHLDPADWGAGYLRVRDREIPDQLRIDLTERVPQALLRDLYRPVRPETPIVLVRHEETALDPGGRRALADARAARARPAIPTVEPTVAAVKEAQAARRTMLREKWQAAMPDDAPRRVIPV